MRIVVTGGAGFIGANLCRELASRPDVDSITVLDDLSTGTPTNLVGVGVGLIEGSILDRALLERTIATADAVVHLAARPSVPKSLIDPVATHEVNATGTVYVLEACRARGTQLVAASSSSVYGSTPDLPKHEELPTRPLSPYAASKLATESYTVAYGAAFDIPVLALRFFNVYGPLQSAGHAYAAVVPAFVNAALCGDPLPVYGDGSQTRDFTYVGTVARVLADAATSGTTSPTPVNLAFGTRVSLNELRHRFEQLLGRPLEVEHRPTRPGDVRDSQAANGRLRQLFPNVTPVPLDEGLRETVRWFRNSLPHAAYASMLSTPTGPAS